MERKATLTKVKTVRLGGLEPVIYQLIDVQARGTIAKKPDFAEKVRRLLERAVREEISELPKAAKAEMEQLLAQHAAA